MNKTPLPFLLVALFIACSEDEEPTIHKIEGYRYFPLQLQQERVYQVDSILYDDFSGTVDTLSFQRRELIKDQFVDDSKRTVFITEVSFRTNDSMEWRVQKDFTQLRMDRRAEVMVDDLTIVPLIFPFSVGESWDGNAFNTKEEQHFQYRDLYQSFEINDLIFDSAITVGQIDRETLIDRYYREEKYAAGIGLIFRKDIAVETELDGEIRNGYEATISLLEFTP